MSLRCKGLHNRMASPYSIKLTLGLEEIFGKVMVLKYLFMEFFIMFDDLWNGILWARLGFYQGVVGDGFVV